MSGELIPPPYVMCVCDCLIHRDDFLAHLKEVHQPIMRRIRFGVSGSEHNT